MVTKTPFKNFEEKVEYLNNLYYEVGQQKSDFELCYMDKKKDINSKWRKWSVIGFDNENKENKKWITIGNNRTILKNEVVLDLEEPDRYEEILKRLEDQGLSFRVFKTGSKGYHFHLLFRGEVSPEDKLKVIECFDCDTQKASERCMIAMEFEKHWKTGNYKELIKTGGDGFNNVMEILSKNNYKEEVEPVEDLEDISNFLTIVYNEKTGEEKSRSVNIDVVAEYIENKFDVRTIYGLKEETIEVYDGGIWTVKGKGVIKAEIERLLETYSKNNVVLEILEKIKRRTEISREETEKIPNHKRALRNGVLDFEDVENIKLLPHNKKYNFRTKWDIDYKPEAKCDKYKELVEKVLDEDEILKFQEWNALHIARKYVKKKFAIYHGPKDTSKTVMMNHLTIVLNGNVSGLTLQDIARGKPFDLLVLKDKDANICDDLSSSDMKAIGGVKKSVGDGYIDGEMKFGDKIRFPNTAKQTYACNKIPNPGEDIDDEAYYGRIILFAFENVVNEDDQDPELTEKITTEGEKSGWLNWAIEGYKRLMKNNKFTRDLSPEETKYFMIKNGNSLAEFSTDVLEEQPKEKISKDDLYKIYCKWCSEHKPKLSPETKEKIGRNLTKFLPLVQASSNGKERYWLNVKINDTYDTLQNTISNIRKESISDNENSIYGFSDSVISVIKDKEFTEEEYKQAGYDSKEEYDKMMEGSDE